MSQVFKNRIGFNLDLIPKDQRRYTSGRVDIICGKEVLNLSMDETGLHYVVIPTMIWDEVDKAVRQLIKLANEKGE